MDLLLHPLELLSHLIALLHPRLELLADVDDHFAGSLQLLSRIVGRARSRAGALWQGMLFKVRRELVVRADELAYARHLQ